MHPTDTYEKHITAFEISRQGRAIGSWSRHNVHGILCSMTLLCDANLALEYFRFPLRKGFRPFVRLPDAVKGVLVIIVYSLVPSEY